MDNFERLSASWFEWGPAGGLTGVATSTACEDCRIVFSSSDYSYHLREEDGWWVIDTVDERGSRAEGLARFSSIALAEKYLVWNWVTAARSDLASGPLGADLYRMGYATGVEVSQHDGGRVEVCRNGDCATVMTGTATLFSHIMSMSVDQIQQMARPPR